MIQLRSAPDPRALAGLVAQAGPGPARYRRALGAALALADDTVAEQMARNMLRTLLRMPGMAERAEAHLSQMPAEVPSAQDASAAGACQSVAAEAGAPSIRRQQLAAAELRLLCADRIDDSRRREQQMAYAQYAVDGLRHMVEEEERA